jgi:hypothetical protein
MSCTKGIFWQMFFLYSIFVHLMKLYTGLWSYDMCRLTSKGDCEGQKDRNGAFFLHKGTVFLE